MAKRSNSDKESRGFGKKPGLFGRIFGPIKLLLNLHLKLAADEIKKDIKRFVTGVISFLFFIFFALSFYLFLNILAVYALKEFLNLRTFYAVLILTSANLLLTLFFLAAAKASFKKPLFANTKKSFKDTFNELK